MTTAIHITEPFGPDYPDLGASVAKFRREARRGLAAMPPERRRLYGEAVLTAFRAKQRSALARETPTHNVHCASGSNHNTGKAVLKAVANDQRRRLLAYPEAERKARTASELEHLYAEAMTEKNKAAELAKPKAEVIPMRRRRRVAA